MAQATLAALGPQLTATAFAPTLEAQRTASALSALATADALQLQRDAATSTAVAQSQATQVAAVQLTAQAEVSATVVAAATQAAGAASTQAWIDAAPERAVVRAQAELEAARLAQAREQVEAQAQLATIEAWFWTGFWMVVGIGLIVLLGLTAWSFFFKLMPVLRRRIGWYRDERTGRSVMVMDASDDVHVITPERMFAPGLTSSRTGLHLQAGAPTPEFQAHVTDAAQKVELAALVRRLPSAAPVVSAGPGPIAIGQGSVHVLASDPRQLPAPRPGLTRVSDITVIEPGDPRMRALVEEVESKLSEGGGP
jgi:hypothetical protein